MTITLRFCALVGVIVVLLATVTTVARAGVAFPDPPGGWDYTYDALAGEDFFGTIVGGQSGFTALDGTWAHDKADWWDGSAPGETFPHPGIDPNDPNNSKLPGGAKVLTEGSTSYLRVQDTGAPPASGWTPAPPDSWRLERVSFGHDIRSDPNNGAATSVINNGITLSFRARIVAGDPNDPHQDPQWPETGTNPNNPPAWPTGGKGYRIDGSYRSPFGVSQDGSQTLAFTLETSPYSFGEDPNLPGGLFLNGKRPGGTGDLTDPNDVNFIQIDDTDLLNWHEFWITAEEDEDPNNSFYWHVKVWKDGEHVPTVFDQVRKGFSAEYAGQTLLMGLPSQSGWGMFDIDAISYKLGAVAPPLLGDVNLDDTVDEEDVDPFIDLLLNGPYQVQADMNQDGVVDGRDVGLFVTTLSGSSASRVPEPSVLALVLAASTGLVLLRGRRRGRAPPQHHEADG